MRGNVPKKARGHSDRAKKQGGPRPTPHKKTCGFACAFLAEIQPKKTPHTPYGEFFSADFISKIHWQNCFAPKKSKFCAELRRDGAGMLTHGKTAQRRSLCKICLLRRMFSYAESAKGLLLFCAPARERWLSAQSAEGKCGVRAAAPRGAILSRERMVPLNPQENARGVPLDPRHWQSRS